MNMELDLKYILRVLPISSDIEVYKGTNTVWIGSVNYSMSLAKLQNSTFTDKLMYYLEHDF